MTNDPRRNYGLGDSTPFIIGVPRIKGAATGVPGCPACGCSPLYEVEVDVDHPQLAGGRGIGVYLGCAACSFASPMMMVSRQAISGVSKDPPTWEPPNGGKES